MKVIGGWRWTFETENYEERVVPPTALAVCAKTRLLTFTLRNISMSPLARLN